MISVGFLQIVQFKKPRRARVSLPVEVIFGLAGASEVEAALFACGAVREGDVVVCNVIEEVDFFLFEQQAGCDGMDGGVAPALVEEAAVLVERFEEIEVCLRAQPVEVADFEVGPLEVMIALEDATRMNSRSREERATYEVAVIVRFAVVVA